MKSSGVVNLLDPEANRQGCSLTNWIRQWHSLPALLSMAWCSRERHRLAFSAECSEGRQQQAIVVVESLLPQPSNAHQADLVTESGAPTPFTRLMLLVSTVLVVLG